MLVSTWQDLPKNIHQVFRRKAAHVGLPLADAILESTLPITAFVHSSPLDLDSQVLKAIIKCLNMADAIESYETDEPLQSPSGRLPFLMLSNGKCYADASSMLRLLETRSKAAIGDLDKAVLRTLEATIRPAIYKTIVEHNNAFYLKGGQQCPFYARWWVLKQRKREILKGFATCLSWDKAEATLDEISRDSSSELVSCVLQVYRSYFDAGWSRPLSSVVGSS